MHICEATEVFVFAENIRFLALMAYVRFCSGMGYSGVWVVSVVGGWWIEQTDNQTWWNHILLSNKESLIWNTCNMCYSEGYFVAPCRKIHFLHNYRISAWKCPWQKNIDCWKFLKTGDTGYIHNFYPSSQYLVLCHFVQKNDCICCCYYGFFIYFRRKNSVLQFSNYV